MLVIDARFELPVRDWEANRLCDDSGIVSLENSLCMFKIFSNKVHDTDKQTLLNQVLINLQLILNIK